MMKPINKYITLFSIKFIILLVLYKAIQIGFLLADSNKINQCTNTRFDLIQWLFFSAIFGLFVNLYNLITMVNIYYTIISIFNYTYNRYDVNTVNIQKILMYFGFVFYLLITLMGCLMCFYYCDNIVPNNINYISKTSIIIDIISCCVILFVIWICQKIRKYVDTNIILGGDFEFGFDYDVVE